MDREYNAGPVGPKSSAREPDGSGQRTATVARRLVHRLPTRPAAEDSRNLKTQLGAVVASMLTIIVLVGRATTVPFTAVLAGLQRTITETATASSTCDGRERRRWRTCPIWLWEQGVASSRLRSGCCLADPPSHPVAIEGHPWRQRHREGTCEFDLSTLGTQPGRQTLLPTACTSGGDRREHRLPVKERWPTSRKSSKSTVRPGLSGWRVPTRRHRPVMRGNCPPSLGDPPPGWSVAGSALPGPAGRSVPGRGGPERRRRPRPDGSGARRYTVGTRGAGR
jgi:hypothetical protein